LTDGSIKSQVVEALENILKLKEEQRNLDAKIKEYEDSLTVIAA
jgi:hypothetical protein